MGPDARPHGRSPEVVVRPVEPTDAETWRRLRTALWPSSPGDHPVEIEAFFERRPADQECVIATVEGVGAGFAEVGLRAYAEGCASSPVGYLEGIYVDPTFRGRGVGRALVQEGMTWARTLGCTEMASDRALDNEASGAFHEAVGFQEAERVVCYRHDLGAGP